jgi:hypothetical protein
LSTDESAVADPIGHPGEEPAGNGRVDHPGRTLDRPDATVVGGDAVDVVARLKEAHAT